MEDKAMQVVQGVKPNVVNWIGAAIGAALAWWTGLPPLAQALLIVQGADVVTGLLCAVTENPARRKARRFLQRAADGRDEKGA
ncbi:MAG: hypothetical protein ACLTV6_13570 [Christensenellales bacterium]